MLIGLAVLMIVIAESCSGDADTSADPPPSVELNAMARLSATQVLVVNQDTFPWSDCTVELNAGIVRGGWSTDGVNIAAGDTATGGLMTFTRSGGERFNPSTHQVESVAVRCDTPTGRRSWMGTFR